MPTWEFAVPGVPVSVNAKDKTKKREWTEFVRETALENLKGPDFPLIQDVAVSITYFHEEAPLDVDNMIKPILDGLWPEIMQDDNQVQDVSGSRRDLTSPISLVNPSDVLLNTLSLNGPFVYITIGEPVSQGTVLWIGSS